VRLARCLVKRLAPALPAGATIRMGDESDMADVRRMRQHSPSSPEYDLEDGLLVVHTSPPPARRVIALTYSKQREFDEDDLSVSVAVAINAVADEASEESTDRFESEAVIDCDDLRIWFGRVPPGSPDGRPWREIVPELPPIRLGDVTIHPSS
jgi:hypothetical protein